MRVIVTGGSGKAGRHTVRELASAGHEVVNLDAARPPEGLPGDFVQLDLTDVGEVYGVFSDVRPEGEIAGHEVFLVAAADTCLDAPIPDAVERLYGPGASFAPDHGPFDSVFDCGKIERRLGWRPRHSWRDG